MEKLIILVGCALFSIGTMGLGFNLGKRLTEEKIANELKDIIIDGLTSKEEKAESI